MTGAPALFALDEQRQNVSIVGLHEEQGLAVARRIADVEGELVRRRLPVDAMDTSLFPCLTSFVEGKEDPQVREALELPKMTVSTMKTLARSRGIKPLPVKRQQLLDALRASPPVDDEEEYRKRLHAVVEREAVRIRAWGGRVEEIRAKLATARLHPDLSTILSIKGAVRTYIERDELRDSAIEDVQRFIVQGRFKAWNDARDEAFGWDYDRRKWTLLFDVDKRGEDNVVAKHEMSCKFIDDTLSAATHGSTRQLVAALLDEYPRQLEAWRERMRLHQARITSYFKHALSWLESVVPREVCRLEMSTLFEVPYRFMGTLRHHARMASQATPGKTVSIPGSLLLFAKRWSLLQDRYFQETGGKLSENLALLARGSRTHAYLFYNCTPNSTSDPFAKLPLNVLREICAPLYTWRRLLFVGGALSITLAFPSFKTLTYPLSKEEIIERIAACIVAFKCTVDACVDGYWTLWQVELDKDLRESNEEEHRVFLRNYRLKIEEVVKVLRRDQNFFCKNRR